MPVAKTYQSWNIIDEPYIKNGRRYIVVERPNGSRKEVRWYTDAEYARMYPEAEAPMKKIRPRKEVLGFEKGYITIFKGDTYAFSEWFKENGATYRTFWGWSFASTQELPELPVGLEPKQLRWEDVAYVDEDELKSQSAIDEAVAALIYEESNSQWIGAVGDRLEVEVLVVKAVELPDGYYGPSTMHIMEDADGNQYVWTTGSRKLEQGENYKLRGSVKEHKSYKRVKQTVLTRCRVG